VVKFQVVHHLPLAYSRVSRLSTGLWLSQQPTCSIKTREVTPQTFLLGLLVASKSFKFYSIWHWLPLEVKKTVNRLYFYPPWPFLHGLPNKLRIVSRSHDEFVAVLYVSIFERYFTFLFFVFWIAVEVKLSLLTCWAGRLTRFKEGARWSKLPQSLLLDDHLSKLDQPRMSLVELGAKSVKFVDDLQNLLWIELKISRHAFLDLLLQTERVDIWVLC